MKHVDMNEIVTAVPVAMTRNEKLRHWAGLVRSYPGRLWLYHDLENYTLDTLKVVFVAHHNSAFALAVWDSSFQKQKNIASIYDIMGFFEVSLSELHEFSCDCGGPIDNKTMACRIEGLIR